MAQGTGGQRMGGHVSMTFAPIAAVVPMIKAES
jgi:hypothetical protein